MPDDTTQLSPLAPQPLEVVLASALVVALLFAVYAIWMVRRGGWTIAVGVTLGLLTFVVPFSGPLLAVYLGVRDRLRARRAPVTA